MTVVTISHMSSVGRIGESIGDYRLERELGWGGMSVVYLAEHVHLRRKVALKLLSPRYRKESGFRERFEHECRRAAEIDHPNIIPVYDAGEFDGEFYIAMRYVHGRDLKRVIADEAPLGLERTLELLEQTAGALDAAHRSGVVHRDVKPANILVEESGERVYLTDFGIAKHSDSHGLTQTGLFLGTVNYAAPEQIEGGSVDGRTDIYALGCVLYECLAARPPFARESDLAVLNAHLTEPPPAVTASRPELPQALDRVVGKAMAKLPEERYSACAELMEAAREARLARSGKTSGTRPAAVPAAAPPESAAPTQAAPPSAAPTRRLRARKLSKRALGAFAAAAVLVVVVAVVLVLVLTGGGKDGEQAGTQGTSDNALQLAPAPLAADCVLESSPPAGATESISCTSSFESGSVRWEAAAFPDEESLASAWADATSGLDAPEGATCAETFSAEEDWGDPASEAGGRARCSLDGDDALIVWTREPSEDGGRWILGSSRVGEYDTTTALDWWKEWRDQIGAPID